MKRGTPEHPKTLRLASELGVNVAHACGILELLWHFSARFSPQGDIGKWDDAFIAKACHWDGEPAQLVRALAICGWLDGCKAARYVVHDWPVHCDESVKKYLKRNNLQFLAPVQRKSRRVQDTSSLPLPLPTPLPTPEPEPIDSSAPDKPAAEPIVVMEFPTVGDGPKTWALTEAKLAEYRESYPGVDVLSECRKARQWCIDVPGNRKTAAGMGRFLTGWLGRSQNGGRQATAAPVRTLGGFGDD